MSGQKIFRRDPMARIASRQLSAKANPNGAGDPYE